MCFENVTKPPVVHSVTPHTDVTMCPDVITCHGARVNVMALRAVQVHLSNMEMHGNPNVEFGIGIS